MPVAVETLGVFGLDARSFLWELGRCITDSYKSPPVSPLPTAEDLCGCAEEQHSRHLRLHSSLWWLWIETWDLHSYYSIVFCTYWCCSCICSCTIILINVIIMCSSCPVVAFLPLLICVFDYLCAVVPITCNNNNLVLKKFHSTA